MIWKDNPLQRCKIPVSKKLYEQATVPLSMSVLVPIIVERGFGRQCDCVDPVYDEADNDCQACLGAGIIVKRTQRLIKASIQLSGQIVDEGDPIIYACTFDEDIQIDDIIVCKGKRYIVIELSSGVTPEGKDVIVAGLDYERNYSHSQTVLSRYK